MSADNAIFIVKVNYDGVLEYKVGEGSVSSIQFMFSDLEQLTTENMTDIMKEHFKDDWFSTCYSYENARTNAKQLKNNFGYTEYGIIELDYTNEELRWLIK